MKPSQSPEKNTLSPEAQKIKKVRKMIKEILLDGFMAGTIVVSYACMKNVKDANTYEMLLNIPGIVSPFIPLYIYVDKMLGHPYKGLSFKEKLKAFLQAYASIFDQDEEEKPSPSYKSSWSEPHDMEQEKNTSLDKEDTTGWESNRFNIDR